MCLGPPTKEDGKYTGLPIFETGTEYVMVGGVSRSGIRRDDEDAQDGRRCGSAVAALGSSTGCDGCRCGAAAAALGASAGCGGTGAASKLYT